MTRFASFLKVITPCMLIGCGSAAEQSLATGQQPSRELISLSTNALPVNVPLEVSFKVSVPNYGQKKDTSQTNAQKGSQEYAMAATPTRSSVLKGPQPYFDVKRCINVANALEAENEGEWGYKVRVEDLREIANKGFDTIRLPVRWDTHMMTRPPYSVSGLYMERVKYLVSQAQLLGLGVILDVHHYEDLIENPRAQEARFLALWSQIATQFAGAPKNVYFEILNEPTNAMSMRDLNALYAKVIPLIRRNNPTRTLIIGGNSWNSVDTMAKIDWPNDKNIVATFHDYGPHEFTHQGAPWTSTQWPLGRKWGHSSDIAEIKDTYKIAAQFQAKRNVPVFVGEFGVIDIVPQEERNAWVKARRKAMESAGYGWCVWDLTGSFENYDTNTRKWRAGALDALFGP